MSEYIAKFSTIYQQNPDEVWKCVKFESGLRKDILDTMRPMEIKDFAILANTCRPVEECNRKLVATKSTSSGFKKGFVPQGLRFKPDLQQKEEVLANR